MVIYSVKVLCLLLIYTFLKKHNTYKWLQGDVGNRDEITERNRLMTMSIEEFSLKRSDKVVLPKWNDTSWWDFSKILYFKYNTTMPKNQKLEVDKFGFKVYWKSNSKYLVGTETFIDQDMNINVYSLERTIVELIKDVNDCLTVL